MDEGTVRFLAQALGVAAFVVADNVRAEGMRAENEYRVANGQSVAYGDDEFAAVATRIEENARRLLEM